ncbi:MAG: carbonic anhydrase [Gammaproteobacteria bacterium]|nr:carbonic anhydrase [Gammaproteobacteria bacterium]
MGLAAIDKNSTNSDKLLGRGATDHLPSKTLPRSGTPEKRVVIVTCMDTRINPYRIFNLREGEVHILRNAGGILTDDVIRSLLISQKLLNTNEILVVQHTKCGMVTFNDEELAKEIEAETTIRPSFEFGSFTDVYENVADSIVRLRKEKFLWRTTSVRGFVYDVDSDKLKEVEVTD